MVTRYRSTTDNAEIAIDISPPLISTLVSFTDTLSVILIKYLFIFKDLYYVLPYINLCLFIFI